MHGPRRDRCPAGSVAPPTSLLPASQDAPTLDVDQADESFNLDVSGSSDDADPAPPVCKGKKKMKKGPAPVPLDFEAPPDPLLQTRASQKTATSDDVNYFFRKQKDKDTICVICEAEQKPDPVAWHRSHGKRKWQYSGNTGNTPLRGHVERFHLLLYLILAEERRWSVFVISIKLAFEMGYTITEMRKVVEGGAELSNLPNRAAGASSTTLTGPCDRGSIPEFTHTTFLQHLVSFIVADDQASPCTILLFLTNNSQQSINVIECLEFRRLLLLLRQELREKDIPHRTKICSEIIKAWQEYFVTLKEDMANAVGKISFTANIWSSQTLGAYLAMTAHWIALENQKLATLELKAALITFRHIKGSHTGKYLAKTILYLLDRADITVKVGHFTMDNAGNNATCMEELAKLLEQCDITFNPLDRRVMCFHHIMNICVQHVADHFTNSIVTAQEVSGVWDAMVNGVAMDKTTYIAAIKKNPVALGRSAIKAIRVSGLRRDEFMEVIKTGNAKQWFKSPLNELVTVPEVKLLRDVCTRWDSTYFMINRLQAMCPAIDFFLSTPNQQDISGHKMTDAEWQVLEDFEKILDVPHRVQQWMSSESMPRLGSAVPCFELFMTAWESLAIKFPRLRPFIDVGLEWAKSYYVRMDLTDAYVIAMLIDPSVRLSWIKDYWEDAWIKRSESMIRNLMVEYRNQISPEAADQSNTTHTSKVDTINSLAQLYGLGDMRVRRPQQSQGPQTIEQEYQSYVNGDLWDEGIEVLKFWEMKRKTYPTLFAIAMDYLPVQASAVSCEQVFSSSAETDTKKWNRISETLMEALQMLKYGLKKEWLNFTQHFTTSQHDLPDDDPDEPSGMQPNVSQDPTDDILATIALEETCDMPDKVYIFPQPSSWTG